MGYRFLSALLRLITSFLFMFQMSDQGSQHAQIRDFHILQLQSSAKVCILRIKSDILGIFGFTDVPTQMDVM